MRPIERVTVVGANGAMGRNISAIFASFGNAEVYMVSRSVEKSAAAVDEACKSVRADCIRKRLIPADFASLERCVSGSDLVFESVAEDAAVKREVIGRIAGSLRDDTPLCTGTSGLSVSGLAECLPERLRKNLVGTHFFNPPYSMPLCELIPTEHTDAALLHDIRRYLQNTLLRTVITVRDTPAFLANRIGFQFINEALQYAELYKFNGGADYIDAIVGPFTGRAMAPARTADFVGLDVCKAITANLRQNTSDYANDTFRCPEFVEKLISDGNFGKKTGRGIYETRRGENGSETFTYDIASGEYRPKAEYMFPFAEKMRSHIAVGDYSLAFSALLESDSLEARICTELLLKYVLYSLSTSALLGCAPSDADKAMAAGFNWCPPQAMACALSEVAPLKTLMRERLDERLLAEADPDRVLSGLRPSEYDHRPFFRAAKERA